MLLVWLSFILTSIVLLYAFYTYFPIELKNYETQKSSLPIINSYRVTDIRVIDGDTIEGDIKFPLNVTLTDVIIRFEDFDAWESSKRRRTVVVTDEEVKLGISATKFITRLLDDNLIFIELDGDDRDVYGRVLTTAIIESENSVTRLKDMMQENDFIRDDRFIK